jgi:hypothetical protein
MNAPGLSALTLLLGLVGARAQDYSIDWWTIDGGGGASTGGVYAITATVGQPDPGTLNGGNYALVGGFWSIVAAVQMPGAPFLEIARTNGQVVVSWLKPATAFVLDHAATFSDATSRWSQVELPYLTNATHISVLVPASAATGYYRLRRR